MTNHVLRVVRWFYPGLGIKRWLFIALIGVMLFVNGATRWMTEEGTRLGINELVDAWVSDFMSPSLLAPIFMVTGLLCVVLGIRQWLYNIVGAVTPQGKPRIVDALVDQRLRRGYKIVAVGGGTGLSTLLRGLKRATTNITAIVTVSDDGGSSGRLQKELGVLPPGDIRNCLVALADDEALVTDLFRYRFSEGAGLEGHSFGNLFLAAMTGITGNFITTIRECSRVLNIKGRVLPATLSINRLCATLADGTTVEGETNISGAAQRIERIYFDPPFARPPDEVITAIREADAIVLGPGSLYTSILPNLLVDRIAREIEASTAVKMYVCNVMTQPGETDGFTASDHVRTLLAGAKAKVCEYAIVNSEPPRKLVEAYAVEGQVPVVADVDAIPALGVRAITANVISETVTVRHDPEKLAAVVLSIIDAAIANRSSFVKFPTSPQPGAQAAV